MSDCLTGDEVRAVVEGKAPARGYDAADEHLLSCEACRAKVREGFAAADLSRTEASDGGPAPETSRVVVDAPEGRYEYLRDAQGRVEELGRGGFGKVLLARDATLGRDVAMKRLTSARLAQSRATSEARLLREARVLGQLEHPAIVPLHELGRGPDGQLYYTMRRIHGRTLADALKAADGLDARLRLLPHVLTACHAIAYAHSRGVVHRDLKPQNVMLDRFGATYVIDWGLAHAKGVDPSDDDRGSDDGALRLVTSDETIGDEAGRIGTMAYMSPEHVDGPRRLVDEKADVWGLGALLYQVLTGRPPRSRDADTFRVPPRPVRALAPDVPEDLAALCDKALAQRREDRYPSAEALAFDLDAWLHGRPVSAHAYRPIELVRRFVRANRVAVAVGAAALLGFLALGAASYARVTTQRNQARAFARLIVDQLLDRLSTTHDRELLTEVTDNVTSWLEAQGSRDDTASVAWAWFLLARAADRVGQAPPAWVRTCLEASRDVDDPVARAAHLGCSTLSLVPFVDDNDPRRLQSLEALWRDAAPTAPSPETPQWVAARRLLEARMSVLANVIADTESERRHTDALLALTREALASGNDRAGALAELAGALERRALVASNLDDGPGAVRFGEEAIAMARQAVALRPNPVTLEALGSAEFQQLSVLRWHVAEPAERDARRQQLGAEARRIYEALTLLLPRSSAITLSHTGLMLELGEVDAAWALAKDLELENTGTLTQGAYLWSALASRHTATVVALRDEIEKAADFDATLALAIALALEGHPGEGADALDRASTLPFASAWPSVAMARFVAGLDGPLADGLRRFVPVADVAQERNDDPRFRAAMAALAAEWRALAARPQGP